MKLVKIAALALAGALAWGPAAHAQMGGGMGMGSSSAPQQDPTIPYRAGVAALNAQNYAEAIRQLRQARRALPSDGNVNYALGLAYAGAGDKDEAKNSFARAVRASNAPVAAHLQLGLVSLELGDRDTALARQAALQQMLQACDAACGDARRGQLQTAYDQLSRALTAAPATQ
jgi:tetratricopeptide (TPR) repeat protein